MACYFFPGQIRVRIGVDFVEFANIDNSSNSEDSDNTNTVRPRSPQFFVPEKIRVDRNVLDRGSSYAMECKIVKKTAV